MTPTNNKSGSQIASSSRTQVDDAKERKRQRERAPSVAMTQEQKLERNEKQREYYRVSSPNFHIVMY
jgi:hypothetical protein